MYNERTNFSLKSVIIQFLFLALLIFILIWLFPLKSDLNNLNSGNNNDLTVLVDRIFNENIISMKDAAKSYYTTPRLPQNVGDKVKMTLGEMLEKKIILPFADKNGDVCSLTDSYVEITKYDEEYVMKVNLKCGEDENYLLVYMGCYDYCSTEICEKDETDVKAPAIYSAKTPEKVVIQEVQQQVQQPVQQTPVINNINNIINNVINIVKPDTKPEKKYYCSIVNGKYYDNKGNVVSKTEYQKACETKVEETKYYCSIVNGKYYDDKGNVVSKTEYQKACETKVEETKYYCSIVNGKYYDNKGNVVSKTEYQKACETKVEETKYYCSIVNGKYYDNKGNVVSKTEYQKACETKVEETKYYCSIVNGKYYDNKGNVVSKTEYQKACETKVEETKYYCKIVNGKYYDDKGNVVSEAEYKKACETKVEETKYYCKTVNGKYYDASGNSVAKLEYQKSCYLFEYKKVVSGTCTESDWSEWSTTAVSASANVAVKTKLVTKKTLIGYNVTTAKDYDKPIYGTKEITIGTKEQDVCTQYGYVPTGEYSYGDWKYVTTVYLNYTPTNTQTTQYIKVDENSWVCSGNCIAGTTKAYKKYERTKTPLTKYQCTKWEKKSEPIKTTVKTITGYETKVVSKEPVYKTTTTKMYSYKTRTCTSGNTYKKWSTYGNATLLNDGYSYTGSIKLK